MPLVNTGRVRVVWEIPNEPDVITIMSAQQAISNMDPLINLIRSGEKITIEPI